MNEKVKIKYKTTGATKEVKKSLASDYIGTGKFELVEEKKEKSNFKMNNTSMENSENKENK